MIRIRIFYKKIDDLIYTGSLDIQKIWERSLRRASLPISYSEGFHPQARIQQATPLPLGFWGENEIVDIWLESLLTSGVLKVLQQCVPKGIEIIKIEEVDLRGPALQSIITAAEYLIIIPADVKNINVANKINISLKQGELLISKKGKTINLKELIESLVISPSKDQKTIEIFLRLKLLPGATGRPDDLLRAININPSEAKIIRKNLIFGFPDI